MTIAEFQYKHELSDEDIRLISKYCRETKGRVIKVKERKNADINGGTNDSSKWDW